MKTLTELSSSWYARYLACPDCGAALHLGQDIRCGSCAYAASSNGMLDLRPKNPSACTLSLSRVQLAQPESILHGIQVSAPEVTYKGPAATRDSCELMSEISKHVASGGHVLDLGCGPRDQAGPVEHLGHHYVGVDFCNQNADFLADCHALPFGDETFDCVLTYAVLEHLHNPFVAVAEVDRVLRPGGILIGTVSQGEPFHASYFHHTAWGFLSLMSTVPSFTVHRLWSSGDTLESLSRMGRYSRIVRRLLHWIHALDGACPWLCPRKMKWPDRDKMLDGLYRAGSVCFVVQKDARVETLRPPTSPL